MKPATVWFNKHLSNSWEIMALLREARAPDEFRVIGTHPRGKYPGQLYVDQFEQEPIGLNDEDYLVYCLEFARRHRVDFFFPGRKVLPIVRAGARFEGTRVLAAADAATLACVNDKAKVYAALAGLPIALPNYEKVRDVASFDAAYARLHGRHKRLCCKPTVSVYGLGFYILLQRNEARLTNPYIDPEKIRERLARKERDLLLMEYLPGPERSVDCLAQDGELLRCVVRRKEDGGQVIEDNPGIVAMVRQLTAHFRLTHLFNVQFRDSSGTSYLLEINPRMSGGLPLACQSGLVLPLWAIRLAMGTAKVEDIPQPRTGLWVPQPEPESSL